MKDIFPRSGYDLAAKILESHPNDTIETMVKSYDPTTKEAEV